ncbi:MAG: glycosyltransferase [Planctomycetes bacterium]|nr:glycosyltransferase [Planctomycetota bacterium]
MTPALSIVFPVYREGPGVLRHLDKILRAVPVPHEILAVVDLDDDPTLPPLREWERLHPHLKIVRNAYGRGALKAIRTGIEYASAPRILVMMSDGSDDPRTIGAMLSALDAGGACVAASRYMNGGRQVGAEGLKRAMSFTAGRLLPILTGVPIHDPTNAFKMYRREWLERFPIQSDGGFEYSLELVLRIHAAGGRVVQVPTTWRGRTEGASNFRLASWLPKYLRWYLLGVAWRLRRLLVG